MIRVRMELACKHKMPPHPSPVVSDRNRTAAERQSLPREGKALPAQHEAAHPKRVGPNGPAPLLFYAGSCCFAAPCYFFMVLVKLSFRVTMRLKAPGFLESGVK